MQRTIVSLLSAVAILLVVPSNGFGQTSIDAGPNPFFYQNGINVSALVYSDYDPQWWCFEYNSCYYDSYDYVEISGSDGFYVYNDGGYGDPSIDVYGYDSAPGQSMQQTTYSAHGYVDLTVWYCVNGCSEDHYYDDGGWASASVSPDPCWPVPVAESSTNPGWGGVPATQAAFDQTLTPETTGASMA